MSDSKTKLGERAFALRKLGDEAWEKGDKVASNSYHVEAAEIEAELLAPLEPVLDATRALHEAAVAYEQDKNKTDGLCKAACAFANAGAAGAARAPEPATPTAEQVQAAAAEGRAARAELAGRAAKMKIPAGTKPCQECLNRGSGISDARACIDPAHEPPKPEPTPPAQKDEWCPRCDSPDPKRHPAVQFEGEVQICEHPFHGEIKPKKVKTKDALGRAIRMVLDHDAKPIYAPSLLGVLREARSEITALHRERSAHLALLSEMQTEIRDYLIATRADGAEAYASIVMQAPGDARPILRFWRGEVERVQKHSDEGWALANERTR